MATAPIIRGDDSPQRQSQTFNYDSSRGTTLTEVWRGTSLTKMTTKWNGTVYTCNRANMQWKYDVAEATFEWSGTTSSGSGGSGMSSLEITMDRWECPDPKTERDAFSHPLFAYGMQLSIAFAGLPVTDLNIANFTNQWRKAADSRQMFSSFYNTSGLWADFASAHPTEAGFMIRSYNRMQAGQTHYQDASYALRHTTETPNGWQRNVSDNNVNRTYTHAQMIAEATDSTLWYLPLPGRLQYKLAAAFAAFAAITPVRANYQIGWLKAPSSETSVGRSRTEISTMFVLDQWPTDLYPVAT